MPKLPVKILSIKKTDPPIKIYKGETYWKGEDLYGPNNPDEIEIFRHFTESCTSIVESRIPKLTQVEALHGWTVTKVDD